jgi:hypothetical protein
MHQNRTKVAHRQLPLCHDMLCFPIPFAFAQPVLCEFDVPIDVPFQKLFSKTILAIFYQVKNHLMLLLDLAEYFWDKPKDWYRANVGAIVR